MRNKLERRYGHQHLHFITCSCYRRRPFLRTARKRDVFLKILDEVRTHGHRLHGGCSFDILRVMFDWRNLLTSLVTSGIVSAGVVVALARYFGDRWMVRYKAKYDQELEAYKDTLEQKRKRIEADLGHRIYIGKTQFDTEYNALKDCFATLGKLRLSFNGLRPILDWLPEDPQERLKILAARLDHFSSRYNPVVDTAASLFPFVPEDIYAEFEKCMKAAILEIRHIEENPSKAFTHSGMDEGTKYREQFETAYFRAAKLARERFRQLSIVSD